MTYLILTFLYAGVETLYDRTLFRLKKYGLDNGEPYVAQTAHKLMHAMQMPARGIYFVTISFGIANELDGYYAWDDSFIFVHALLLVFTNIAWFWLAFDFLINTQVLMVKFHKLGGGWEEKYFGWMTGYGYLAMKMILFGVLLGLSIHYNI